ncbi:MAG: SatD family protein [Rikenellaceae bacterium]
MTYKAIITGDIVNSSQIVGYDRTLILDTIKRLAGELSQLGLDGIEMYRGDSFQMVVRSPENALLIAILTRASLRARDRRCDARIAIGVGTVEYNSIDIVTSDGEAYRNSGREFDNLKKRRLAISTPWTDVNEELNVSTAFADDIITNWSDAQANVIFMSLSEKITQKEIAQRLNKKSQSVSNVMNSGKESLVAMYIDRYTKLINNKIITPNH